MGMSSSQARLLNLTARMHQIEYKAAKLEAQKLQMANESKRVYNDYLNALESSKIQYKALNADGSITYKDATLNILQNGFITSYAGEHSQDTLFIQSMSGQIMLTPTVADAFGIDIAATGVSMDDYVHSVTGKDKIISDVNPLQTNKLSEYVIGYNYSPVANIVSDDASGSNTGSVMIKFNDFVNTPDTSRSASVVLNNSTDISSSNTFFINDLAGLQKLQSLCANSSFDSQNYTFVLGNDIDMSSITNWTGINNFKGKFYGNGHTISGLNGSKGLFSSANGATIEDLKLVVNKITGGSHASALICDAYGNVTVNNCIIDINEMTGSDHVGGIFGETKSGSNVTATNCAVNVNISTTSCCTGGILGHAEGNVNIDNCYVSGEITSANNWTGGIFGHNSGNATATITNSTVYVKVNQGGSVMGYVDNADKYTIANVTYNKNLNPNFPVCGNNNNFETTNNSQFLQMIITPSIDPTNNYNGSFYSNIYGALHKYKNGDMTQFDETKVRKYAENLYKTTDNALKVANINDYLCDYLVNDNFNQAFFAALVSDIQNGTIANTTAFIFQTKYNSTNANVYLANIGTDAWAPVDYVKQKGEYKIPAIDTMKEEVYYLLMQDSQQNGSAEISQSAVNTFFAKYSLDNTNDKISLANLNDIIYNKNVAELRSIINSGNKYTNTANYPSEYYNINNNGYSAADVSFAWDTTQPDVANAIKAWYMSNRGFGVFTEEQSSNKEYLENYIEGALGVFAQFDPNNIQSLFAMSADEWMNLSDEDFNRLLSVEHTSVSTNTSVQEVTDEVNLKKAEAKYEADMKRIDLKDRKYDTDLAALDAERNAIKQEMETLKTVAKDNVERTFRLFS